MRIMGAHEMLTTGADVTGTVADTYEVEDLVNGEPHDVVRTDDGSFSFAISRTPGLTGINGLFVGYHNLDADLIVTFSGLGTVTALRVPENDIRLNAFTLLDTPAGSVSSFTASASGNGADCVLGEIIAGIFREIFPIAAGPQFQMRGFGIPHPGEFSGRGYSKGGEARRFGGTGWVTDAEKQVLDSCWRASRDNSLPTILIPFDWSEDAWDVNWESYDPSPHGPDAWEINVVWQEVARLRLSSSIAEETS